MTSATSSHARDCGDRPLVSVVIPTCDRLDRLQLLLAGLADQAKDVPFEVIVVVSDASTDGTDEFLTSDAVPLPVIALSSAGRGPAAALNRGVEAAIGDIVLLLEDDVVPARSLVAAHARHHRTGLEDVVVIGPMSSPPEADLPPWLQWEQLRLLTQYLSLMDEDGTSLRQFWRAGDHGLRARRAVNASVARRHLRDVGGFDPDCRGASTVELAYRLALRGLRFVFDPDAVVTRDVDDTFQTWLDKAARSGHDDAIGIRDCRQRWLMWSIANDFHDRHWVVRHLIRLAIARPRLRALGRTALSTATRCVMAFTPGQTNRALSLLHDFVYFGGIADELGEPHQLLEAFDRATSTP